MNICFVFALRILFFILIKDRPPLPTAANLMEEQACGYEDLFRQQVVCGGIPKIARRHMSSVQECEDPTKGDTRKRFSPIVIPRIPCCTIGKQLEGNHLEERLLDQAYARTPYTPLFWGRTRNIPQGMIGCLTPCKIITLRDKVIPNKIFDFEPSTPPHLGTTFLCVGGGGGEKFVLSGTRTVVCKMAVGQTIKRPASASGDQTDARLLECRLFFHSTCCRGDPLLRLEMQTDTKKGVSACMPACLIDCLPACLPIG